MSYEFGLHLKQCGIVSQLTPPGKPQRNGLWCTFYHRSEGKLFIAENGSFLKKEFLSKEVSGRKVDLDEVTVPTPLLESSSSQKSVPVTNTLSVSKPADLG